MWRTTRCFGSIQSIFLASLVAIISLALLESTYSFKLQQVSWMLSPRSIAFASRSRNRATSSILSSRRRLDASSSTSSIKSTKEGEDSIVDETESSTSTKKSSKEAVLDFVGKVSLTSKEFPMPDDPNTILKFIQEKQYSNLLMSAGGSRPVENIELTSQLVDEWKMYCNIVGSKSPRDVNDINSCWGISTETSGINFFGLIKVISKGIFGAQIVRNTDTTNEAPVVFEVTGLSDRRKVTGFPPFVAIYKKLTGEDKDLESSAENTKVSSLARVSYERVEGNDGSDNKNFVFTVDAVVNIKIKFPSFLLKILPQDKSKTEKKGSQAVSKAMKKDVEKSISAFEDAYEEYINASTNK